VELSEAIRIGAQKRPQGHWDFFTVEDGQVLSCALGAAFEGIANYDADPAGYRTVYRKLNECFSATLDAPTQCPVCHFSTVEVRKIIVHLNDTHRWTREAIADWVETIEKQSTAPERA
jgi:hypothetical protein